MDGDLLKDYQEFVDEVSSDATKNIDDRRGYLQFRQERTD